MRGAAVLCFCVAIGLVSAQDSSDLEIYSLHVRSDIQLRFATTLVTSRVVNRANRSNEVQFSVTLPTDAFISNFTMEIDGVVYPGVVESKAAAAAKFKKAKKKGKSTGLVSNWPPDSNNFRVQVNVAALSKVTFNLTYQELLKRTVGVYQHRVYIDPGQPVRDLMVVVAIQETRDITTLRVPPIQENSHVNAITTETNPSATISRPTPKTALVVYIPTLAQQTADLGTSLTSRIPDSPNKKTNPSATITRPTPKTALVVYTPTLAQQTADHSTGISGHFVVEYDIERSLDAGDLLVVNGYFVHFLAPAVGEPIPNDVLFVLDMSGSMGGTKLRQLKQAMLEVLEELKEGDRFNIMEFTGSTKFYKKKMITVTPETLREAMQYVNGLRADGWTNINDALLDGLDLFRRSHTRDANSPIFVFLTDGLPSGGETNKQNILNNVIGANEGGVPIFSLAFGNDADWDLVKTVAVQNDGFGRKIFEGSDAALQITGFYDEIAVTLVNDVNVKYLDDVVANNSLTQSKFRNFFQGSEIVIAGKLEDPNTRVLNIEVSGETAEGSLKLNKDADALSTLDDIEGVTGLMEISDIGEIAEKLWAYMTIKQIMDDTVREMNTTARAQLKKRALEMSLQYGFVTPLTSMVVTRPEDLDDDLPDEFTTTTPPPTTRRPYRRYGGGYSGGGGGDPHYMVRITGLLHPLCFDVKSKADEVHTVIRDPANDITVNTLIVGSGSLGEDGEEKTFIGQVSVQLAHHLLVVTPDAIFYDTKVFTWDKEIMKHFGGSRWAIINDGTTVQILLKLGAEILIQRHVRGAKEKEEGKVNYLNLYVNHEDRFSKRTTGLIGQFVNGHRHILLKKEEVNKGGKTVGKFQLRERSSDPTQLPSPKPVRHVIRGQLVNRSEVIRKGEELCWMVHNKFLDILLGPSERYMADAFIQPDAGMQKVKE